MVGLSIGTDCSGIEAPLQALEQMKIKYIQEFASEIDPKCKETMDANYPPPKHFFKDITKRKHNLLKKNLDIYVCGFPCQSYSLAGKKLGSLDVRSKILNHCIKTIKNVSPKVFILENVKNFKSIEKGELFKKTIKKLQSLNEGSGAYNIMFDILNTKDYGIPQNRERLFIIGIRKDVQIKKYSTPRHLKMKPINKFLEKISPSIKPKSKTIKELYKKNSHKVKKNKPIIISSGQFGTAMNIAPTITLFKHFIYNQNRYMTAREALALQGFSPKFNQVVSNSELYKQAGNSITVNVLKSLFSKIFDITNCFL